MRMTRATLRTAVTLVVLPLLHGCSVTPPLAKPAAIGDLHWSRVEIADRASVPIAEQQRIETTLRPFQGDAPALIVIPAFAFRPGAIGIEAAPGESATTAAQILQPPRGAHSLFAKRWQAVYMLTLIPPGGGTPRSFHAVQSASSRGAGAARRKTFDRVMRDVALAMAPRR